MTPVAYLFNGLTLSEIHILSFIFFCPRMALCSVLSCYPVYSLPTAFIPQTSLGLVFLPRDPAVLFLFVIPSLWFLLVLHRVKPLCQLFFHSRWCFSRSLLGPDLSWPHRSQKGLVFGKVSANFRLSVSFALHLSPTVCEDPPSKLFSVLSSSFLELSSALRVTTLEANSRPQAHPLCSSMSSPSLSSPAFGSHPLERSLLRFPPPYAHTSQKLIGD